MRATTTTPRVAGMMADPFRHPQPHVPIATARAAHLHPARDPRPILARCPLRPHPFTPLTDLPIVPDFLTC